MSQIDRHQVEPWDVNRVGSPVGLQESSIRIGSRIGETLRLLLIVWLPSSFSAYFGRCGLRSKALRKVYRDQFSVKYHKMLLHPYLLGTPAPSAISIPGIGFHP